MPLMPPVVVLDPASRERSEEAAVFSFPDRCRPLTRSTIAGVCYKSICLSSKIRNSGIKKWYSQGRVVLAVLDLLASCVLAADIPATRNSHCPG